MNKFLDNNFCFACGRDNTRGLQLQFQYDRQHDGVNAEIIFPDHFQGWSGVVHGGLVATVLDEIMVKSTEAKGFVCVTAEIFIKYKNPALTNTKYFVSGKIVDMKRKLIFSEGHISDMDNRIIAHARAKFFIMDRK
jgi:uncharacterized protein (TIGR00369 family)